MDEPSPVEEVESYVYLLDRVLQAGMVYWHILDDRETAEELFRIVEVRALPVRWSPLSMVGRSKI